MSHILFTSVQRWLLVSIVVLGPIAASPVIAQTSTAKDAEPPDVRRSAAPGGLFFLSSPFQRAVRRGMRPGGDLASELTKFEYYEVSSRKDARAVCEALTQLPHRPSASASSDEASSDDANDGAGNEKILLRLLTSLFENVESFEAPGFAVLRDEGIPELVRVYDAILSRGSPEDPDDLLRVLEVLTMYESQAGADRIVQAVRAPLAPDSLMWSAVFEMVAQDTTYRDSIYRALSETPPSGYAAVALLDVVNQQAIDGHLPQHPFNTAAGTARLEQLLQDGDPDRASYAQSATVAIPFLDRQAQDRLLKLAMAHPSDRARLEAGWAAAKLGHESGLDVLKQFSLDVDYSARAVKYLEELKRGGMIPAAAKDPEFRARAEFSDWLSHPAELGRSPDEVTVVDRRELAWPPEKESKPFSIVRFRSVDPNGLAEDQVDVGLVGSQTWCFFSLEMTQRPPEDIYAIHCAWELEQTGLIETVDIDDPSVYAPMLAQWTGGELESPRIDSLARLSDTLGYGSKRVAIAVARRDGQEGWVVLDGPRSTWYAKSEQPNDTYAATVLRIHLGRHLLGLLEPVDRAKFLTPPPPVRPPQEIIAAYEKLMNELPGAKPARQSELLGWDGPLSEHLDRYISSVVEIRGGRPEDVRIGAYERLLAAAAESDRPIRSELLNDISFLGRHFESYIDALLAVGRQEEAARAVERLAREPEFDLGLNLLGQAAFKAGRRDLAERLLDKFRRESEAFYYSPSMAQLAEIWHERGESQRSQDLLLDCQRKLAKEISESGYETEREELGKVFEQLRTTYLKLFPDGESELPAIDVAPQQDLP